MNVENTLILTTEQSLPRSDFVYSYGVLEHIEKLDVFLNVLRKSVNPGGTIVFALPTQDDGGYDVFFADHVWHFSVNHVRLLLHQHGFTVMQSDVRHPVVSGASLFVCEVAQNNPAATPDSAQFHNRDIQTRNKDHWSQVFNDVDQMFIDLRDNHCWCMAQEKC